MVEKIVNDTISHAKEKSGEFNKQQSCIVYDV